MTGRAPLYLAHDHGAEHAMAAPLPGWLAVLLGVASLLVLLPHARHVAEHAGRHRWWHAAHSVMALGMAQMYLLGMGHRVVDGIGLAVFAALGAAMVAAAVADRGPGGAVNPLWVVTALDMAAMAYMYAPESVRPESITWAVIGYLAAVAATWAVAAGSGRPLFVTAPAAAPVGAPVGAPVHALPESAAPGPAAPGLNGRQDRSVCLSLAVMALLMAYMLLVMV